MASKSSKTLPFLVLAIILLVPVGEAYFETDIDLESYTPILLALGVTGGGVAAVKKAAEIRKTGTLDFLDKKIKEEVRKAKGVVID